MNKQIEKQIVNIYTTIYKKIFNKERTMMLSSGSRIDIESMLASLENSKQYDKFAKEFSLELSKKGLNKERGLWKKYYEAAKASHNVAIPATYKDYELESLANTVRHNFKMIKSIPTKMMEILNHKYTSELIEEVAKGTMTRGSFERLLASHGQKQAKLIARTETAKLQTAITKQRAMNVGAKTYTWVTSNDRRVRPSHKAMNGVIVFWRPENEKPHLDNMIGDAGEYPNCRCDALPNVDINDFKDARYKVYDYRQHKIISMTRNQLVAAIQKGGL